MTLGNVHKIESFGLVDGPGVRCVVFLKGCALRCRFCHNPDTWDGTGGVAWEPARLVERVLRFRPYWSADGGVTVSGGEPLLQIDFLIEFFRLLKKEGVNTCIDTAGQPFRDDPAWMAKFEELMQYTDLVMLDIKDIDNEAHISLTGKPNTNILEMARWLSDHGKAMWIRHVLIPGLTDDEDNLRRTGEFIATLKTVKKVENLPYHSLGVSKYEDLGIPYTLMDAVPPTPAQKQRADELLGVENYKG